MRSARIGDARVLVLKVAVSLILLTACLVLPAQTQAPKRKTVGLALSGGSALGLAHIGVLKYFEEHHIPVDYIAGTSMGGLVGGFYSTGLSSTELEQIATQVDWADMLSPNPRFVDQPVVEKQSWNKAVGSLTLYFGHRVSLPTGINSGQALALLFSRYTMAYANLNSFDDLPVPFRCVATDLVSASAQILDRGSLPKALRATMALPGIFTPVISGDKVLVDGGLVENLPVEPARAMGADIVIAVIFEGKRTSAMELRSLSSVLRQTVSLPVIQNEQRSAALADILIRVQTGSLSGSSYESSAALIQKGYEAAESRSADLAPLALPPHQWEAYLAVRKRRIRQAPSEGPLVAVFSPQPAVQRDAERQAYRELGADPIRREDLEHVLSGMVAASGLPGAYYEWQDEASEPQGYRVEFLPRPGSVLLVRPQFFFQLSNDEPSRGALGVGTTLITENTYKSRYLGQFNLGYDPGMRAEYYRPFDGTAYFIAPGIFVQRYNDNLYSGPARTSFQRVRAAGSFYAGAGSGRFAQISFGVQAGYDSYSQPVTTDGVAAQDGGFANPEATWIYNTQDSGGLPSRGTLVEGSLGYSFRNTSFPYLKNRFSTFHPVGRHASVFAGSDAASSFGKKLSFFDQFPYGGARELDAYRYQEFHANSLVSGSAGAFLRALNIRRWSINPEFAAWYQAARLDLGSQGWQTHQSTSLGVFIPSPIGTAGLTLSFTEKGKARVRLLLGSF
jgi:NTE family protein